jgi:hypothetical protein
VAEVRGEFENPAEGKRPSLDTRGLAKRVQTEKTQYVFRSITEFELAIGPQCSVTNPNTTSKVIHHITHGNFKRERKRSIPEYRMSQEECARLRDGFP